MKYGLLIKEHRFLRRAIFVVNRDDTIAYSAYMPTIGDEPNYTEVLDTARHALRE
jgi:peroxiredoxin